MKKYLSGIMMAVFVFIAILPLQVAAADKKVVHLEKDGSSVHVSAVIPEAAGEKVSSLYLALQVTDQNGNGVSQEILDQIETLSFTWSQNVQARAKITEPRYQRETGILRIYIAGTDPLFVDETEEQEGLSLGTVSVALKSGQAAGAGMYISVVPDSLKIVRGAENVQLPTEEVEAVPIGAESGDSPSGSGSSNPAQLGNGDMQEPGSGENTAGSSGGSAGTLRVDKSQLQEVLNLAAEYKEADYTSESYSALKKAMKEGQTVLEDAYAPQTEVDQAVELIRNAIGSLVPEATTSVEERQGQDTLYAGQNQAVGTGDMIISWQLCVVLAILSIAVLAGTGMWKRNQKG